MKNSLSFSLILGLLCFTHIVFAQVKGEKKPQIPKIKDSAFTGKIIKKPWAKSGQSYCAQGSDYFVLQGSFGEIVLENQTKADLNKFEGKKVKIMGFEQTRTIKPDPNSQHPVEMDANGNMVSSDYTCKVLVVKKISKGP
jgi:hypothetical protein